MKRPFVWLCIALAIVPAVRYAASEDTGGAVSGGIAEDASPAQAAAWLAKEAAGGTLTVTGTVARCSAASAGVRLSVNHLTIQRKDNSEQTLSEHIQIAITTEQTDLLPGDRILASGEVMEWAPATNPGQFDQREYYFLQNTACMLTRADIRKLQSGEPGLDRALCRLRRMLSASYDRILGAEEAGAMAAISLGERGRLSQEWKDRFQEGGISHILAVSGLHVSMIGMGLYGLLRRFGAPYPPACAVSGLAVLFYARMSGSGISALRAALMFLVWLGAQLCGRKYDMTTAVAAAAAALILGNPGSLYQSSFLLSFAAVLSIALLLPYLKTVFFADRRGGAARKGSGGVLADAVLSGAGIMIGTLPVTLYFFYQISPWSLLVNLIVLPLMSALMVCGLLAAAVGLLSVPLGIFCAAPAGYILRCFDLLCGLERRLPCPVWVAGRPALWRIALYYGILLAAGASSYRLLRGGNMRHAGCGRTQSRLGQKVRECRENRARKRHAKCECVQSRGRETVQRRRESAETRLHMRAALRFLWIFCAAGCLCLVSPPARKDLAVYCLDVGQGDAQLLCLPGGTTCLIDGGSSSESQVWRYRIGQAVRYCGVRTLDYIFLSHADQDHISGVEEYLEEYEAGFGGANVHGVTLRHLVLPPTADAEDFAQLKALAGRNGIEVLQMAAGAQIGSAGVQIRAADAQIGAAGVQIEAGGAQTESVGAKIGEAGAQIGASRGDLPWSITCLAPPEAELSGERNEDSMVLMLRYGAFRMLFTGDLEGDAELRLAASGKDLSADVLKVGHHGSRGASSQEFLRRVTPAAAVISCGVQNSYGHPSPETLARLEDAGSRIYRTPETGAVEIRSDGRHFTVKTWRGTAIDGTVRKRYNEKIKQTTGKGAKMVKIICDSTCDLSKELLGRYDISILPLHILLGEKEYNDGMDLSPEEIYEWADANKTTPKTSAPSLEEAVRLFEPYTKAGTELICFSISSEMSASANVMRLAAQELGAEEQVTVIDSRNLSTGIGLLAVEAAIQAGRGLSSEEIVGNIGKLIPRVRASFVVDTLTYLYRGGRCSGLTALAGTALKLHPRIDVTDGAMKPGSKYRGGIDRVIMHYARDLEPMLREAVPDRVFITHSGCGGEIVKQVYEYLEGLHHFDEILETRAGGVISSHCGPGTLGVLFIGG